MRRWATATLTPSYRSTIWGTYLRLRASWRRSRWPGREPRARWAAATLTPSYQSAILGTLFQDSGQGPLPGSRGAVRRWATATLTPSHQSAIWGGYFRSSGPSGAAAPEGMRATRIASIGNLGQLFQAQGKLEEAEPLLREDLEGCRATLGDRHPHTLASLNNAARLLHDMGKLDEAEKLLRESMEGCRATLAQGHRTSLRAHGWLADVLRAQGRTDEARKVLDASVLDAARASSARRLTPR